jgi:hypothetical protein
MKIGLPEIWTFGSIIFTILFIYVYFGIIAR